MKLNGRITEQEVRELIENYLLSKGIVPLNLEPFIDYEDSYGEQPLFSGYKFEMEK